MNNIQQYEITTYETKFDCLNKFSYYLVHSAVITICTVRFVNYH